MSGVHSAAVGTSDWHAVFFQFIAQSFDRQDRIVEHRQLLFDATHMTSTVPIHALKMPAWDANRDG